MSAIETEVGVGQCPDRPSGFGHVWAGTDAAKGGGESNPCRFCGTSGRAFFAEWCHSHGNLFVGVHLPMLPGSGKPRELTETQQAKVREIIADKKRRDAEAVANGTARPGQIAGAKGKAK